MKLTLFLSTSVFTYFFSLFNGIGLKSEKREIDFSAIQTEIEWFIEKVKPESYKQGQHNVYVVKIYEGKREGEYCVTMGYIENSRSIRHIDNFKYYMLLKEDLIVLDYSNDFKEKYSLKNADSIKLLTNKQVIVDKMDMEIEIIGTSSGYVCCYDEGNIIKVYYYNSEEIPSNQAIFKITSPASGTIIEVDSSTFKQMLRDKQKKSIK